VITQVTLRFEIVERIECHCPDSRK
jgi:hypothetical protein